MTSEFKVINPDRIVDNTFELIRDDWMLITAGNAESFNTMTASWGAFGELWNKKVCFCFVRPTRHTYGFMEKADTFTLTFFDEKYRDVLKFCGTKSGRDVDKVALTGLSPITTESGSIYFAEARLVLECHKIYFQNLDPEHFIESGIHDEYPEKDYHRMYIGEVISCLSR